MRSPANCPTLSRKTLDSVGFEFRFPSNRTALRSHLKGRSFETLFGLPFPSTPTAAPPFDPFSLDVPGPYGLKFNNKIFLFFF